MAIILSDLIRVENGETGLHYALRNQQVGFASDTKKMIYKYADGSVSKYLPEDQMLRYGVTGVQGPAGVTGAFGVGAIGYTGAQGLQGVTGLQGAPGSGGTVGSTGAQGLQGPQGNQGPQGIQGNVGPQGATGVQGTAGSQGIQGATGAMAPNQMSGSGTSDSIPLFNGTNSLTNSKITQSGSWVSIDAGVSVTGMVRGGITVVRNSLVTPNDHSGDSMGVTGGYWHQVPITGYSEYMPFDMGNSGGKIVANYAGTYYCHYEASVSCNALADNSGIVEMRIRRYDPDTSEYLNLYSYNVNDSLSGYQHISSGGFINLVAGSTVDLQIKLNKEGTIYVLNQRFCVFRIGVTQI